MPRYCAVKVCTNRGGTASRQDKRISFYPFPLQDKSRLQKWVDNMKREEWTPSRHQYLCSEHFKEDCFDIRWGIRYLKNTAIPTLFPSIEDVYKVKKTKVHPKWTYHLQQKTLFTNCSKQLDRSPAFTSVTNDGEKKVTTIKQSPKAKPRTLDIDIEPTGFDSPLGKRPLILGRTCKKVQSSSTNSFVCERTEMIFEPPLASDTGISCHSHLSSEIRTAAREVPGDCGMPTASCIALSPCNGEKADSIVTVLCCESVGPFSDGENVDAAALQAAMGQDFSCVPVELVMDEPTASFLEDRGPSEGEHIYAYEHSYCRPDTDRDQLWHRILSLHAKILGLDRREESTLAKIRALETEVALLKRDGAVFKEKQKLLEDDISSMLL